MACTVHREYTPTTSSPYPIRMKTSDTPHNTQRKMDVEVATMNRLAVERLVAAEVDASRETVA